MEEPPRTILVVEDNAIARAIVAALLRRHGYGALMAESGEQALDLLKSGARTDLVLLDMHMPASHGWYFPGRLRDPPGGTARPIGVTTGGVVPAEWARANGCAGFLRKPIEETALLAEVRRCLGDHSPLADS